MKYKDDIINIIINPNNLAEDTTSFIAYKMGWWYKYFVKDFVGPIAKKKKEIFDFFSKLTFDIKKAIVNKVNSIGRLASQAKSYIENKIVTTVKTNPIKTFKTTVFNKVLKPIGKTIKAKIITPLVNNYIKPVINQVSKKIIRPIMKNVIEPIGRVVHKTIFKPLKKITQPFMKHIVSPIINKLVDIAKPKRTLKKTVQRRMPNYLKTKKSPTKKASSFRKSPSRRKPINKRIRRM